MPLLTVISCSEIIDDCLFSSAKPNIKTEQIPNGRLGFNYFQAIEGEVKHHANNEFIYNFDITGNFPEGLNYSTTKNKLFISGIPLKNEVFKFEIIMTIRQDCFNTTDDESFDCDNVCSLNNSHSKTFELQIEP